LKLSQEWERGDKGEWMEVVNSSMIYLIYYKNKCHTVLPPSTTVKEKDYICIYKFRK
jgi:hypothetical protein